MSAPQISASRPIRAVVLGLFRHGDRILVEDYGGSVNGDRFCRPLGGGIEFGERSEAALVREIREELGEEIEDVRLAGIVENLFVYEGKPGHEVVFVYDAVFTDKTLYDQTVLRAYEHGSDTHFTAQWRSLAEISAAGFRLVPEELVPLLGRA